MKVAIGTKNPAKIAAVRQALTAVWPDATFLPTSVPSGVSDMPMSDAECIAGARNRATAARQLHDADLGIGLEGGVNPEAAGLMLLGWVIICHRDGREGIACTAKIPLPTAIAQRVLAGEELGPLIGEMMNDPLLRQKGGAAGMLSAGQVSRTDKFAQAVSYALSRFIAPHFYENLSRL